jgi:hypothetical protein
LLDQKLTIVDDDSKSLFTSVNLCSTKLEELYSILNSIWGFSKDKKIGVSINFFNAKSIEPIDKIYWKDVLNLVIKKDSTNLKNHLLSNKSLYLGIRFVMQIQPSKSIPYKHDQEMHYRVLGDGFCAFRAINHLLKLHRLLNSNNASDLRTIAEELTNSDLNIKSATLGYGQHKRANPARNDMIKLVKFHREKEVCVDDPLIIARINAIEEGKPLSSKYYPTDAVFNSLVADGHKVDTIILSPPGTCGFIFESNESSYYSFYGSSNHELLGADAQHLTFEQLERIVSHCKFITYNGIDHFDIFFYRQDTVANKLSALEYALSDWCQLVMNVDIPEQMANMLQL